MWQANQPADDASCEEFSTLIECFLQLNLEDKVDFKGKGNVSTHRSVG